jgi:hypothetical protein
MLYASQFGAMSQENFSRNGYCRLPCRFVDTEEGTQGFDSKEQDIRAAFVTENRAYFTPGHPA